MPPYEPGDYVKFEFPNRFTGVGELLWVIVDRCDEELKAVVGRLDNEPGDNHGCKIHKGKELLVRYDLILEHRKPWGFKSE